MASQTTAQLVGSAVDLAEFKDQGFGARLLVDTAQMRVVLVALAPGQQIPIHAPAVDLAIAVLAGTGRLRAGPSTRWVRAGDVAVIPAGTARGLRAEGGPLIALNSVSPPPTAADHVPLASIGWPAVTYGPDPAELIRSEHSHLHEPVQAIAALAAQVAELDASELRARLRLTVDFLERGLLPHAQEEERSVYPAVEHVLHANGGATATMKADHRRIQAMTSALRDLLATPLAKDARAGLSGLLYGLEAVLQLHFEKEEEVYLPLLASLSPIERELLFRHLGGDPSEVPQA